MKGGDLFRVLFVSIKYSEVNNWTSFTVNDSETVSIILSNIAGLQLEKWSHKGQLSSELIMWDSWEQSEVLKELPSIFLQIGKSWWWWWWWLSSSWLWDERIDEEPNK